MSGYTLTSLTQDVEFILNVILKTEGGIYLVHSYNGYIVKIVL